MSSLDFLSPDRAAAYRGSFPVLHSSAERHLRHAGATFEQRGEWLVAKSVPGEAERLERVGLVDLSHVGKIEVRGEGSPDESADVLDWYSIRPDRHLVLCRYPAASALRDKLANRFELVLDQTGAYSVLALVGPQAGALLRRLTHMHEFPTSGALAHVTAHVLEREGGYWIVFGQEYGHYVWEVALDAAEPFGGGPVGLDAALGLQS